MRISADGKTIIAVDSLTSEEILSYIRQDQRHKDKFKDIASVVLERLNNRHLYRREKISQKIKNVTAMRFFVGQENDRIYCQEMSEGDKKIVVLGILLLHKTSETLSSRELKEITTLSSFKYELERNTGK